MKLRRVVSRLEDAVCESRVYGTSVSRGAASVDAILRPLLEDEPIEIFVALLLDSRHRITGYVEVSRGTLGSSLVHPREVFGPAVRLGASGLIVGHNHPSGDPTPSQEDRDVTLRLIEAGKILGIPLMDHVMIGNPGYASLRELMGGFQG